VTAELTRRELVEGAAATSVSVVLAGCSFPVGGGTVDDGGNEPDAPERTALRIEEYPRAKVASLDEVGPEPTNFTYPLEGQTNFVVKLGERANGGVGPDDDIVAFSYKCTHMGCSLEGQYKPDHGMLGACPCHLSRFDLTNYGMVVTGHATESLPQVLLEVDDGDVYASGVMGLVYGFRDNLADAAPSEMTADVVRPDDDSDGGTAPGGGPTTTPTRTETGGDSVPEPDFGGWFDDVDNFDGVADHTGENEVRVTVGAAANGGNFGFAPPAVRVSTGTTVVWEWNGKGGSHNVVAEDGRFESELTATAGHTFTHTFESAGTAQYVCTPHRSLGMKGAVVVDE